MNANDPNIVILEIVAKRLGDALLHEVVFVGGAAAGLLITDPAMPAIRPTEDVDTICQTVVLPDYHRIEAALRQQGFVQDMSEGAPICRWRIEGVAVDVMPTLEHILGFSNRWYPLALKTAAPFSLPSGRIIRLIAAPVFVATKLEAFAGRGGGDYLSSHDLEDILAVIDGRATLMEECNASVLELREYLSQSFAAMLKTPTFVESLAGHLPGDQASQARLPGMIRKLRQLSELSAT